MSNFVVRKVAVLGAGVMGAQIAAHCANANVPVVLFDLAAKEGSRSGIVNKAIDGMKKLQPAPFASAAKVSYVDAANYEEHIEQLKECDLIIEAIAEKMEWKLDLYKKVAPHLRADAIFASNTSGLSINTLAEGMPADKRSHFCGIHFFNPPRYMSLVEIIPTKTSSGEMLDQLETWLTTTLGKSIVRAKDTPNFVANRVGVFSMLAVMHHTERLGLGFDEVDALTGPLLGRPKSATYRTADVVGLDTMAHVIATMKNTLPDDPWHSFYEAPAWLKGLLEQGALGQKTGAGVFRKEGKQIMVLDPANKNYRASSGVVAPEVLSILKNKNVAEKFAQLRASAHPQAKFLWAIYRDVFHYVSVHLASIADNARDVDMAMRWGFGWQRGPFETWQSAGWKTIAEAVAADIQAGQSMASVALPDWVLKRDGVHEPAGSYSAAAASVKPKSSLAVYKRQLYPEQVVNETPPNPGETIFENSGVRFWKRPDQDARIGILSFTSKMHALGNEVVDGVQEAIAFAERELDGLVIWHEAPFAVGANLQQVAESVKTGKFDLISASVANFQQAAMSLRYSKIPTVAAAQGMALGGGCEFFMHTDHRVMALETYVGLVEAGVGLIPAGGGCKELARRASELARRAAGGDVFLYIQPMFNNIAMATVSKSAIDAIDMGFARNSDDIVFHPSELLYVAIKRARAYAESGYRAPVPQRNITVAGRNGIATCEMMLANMVGGNFISEHDYMVAKAAATALCGGFVETNSEVNEQWLLDVERERFITLLKTEKTQQRIVHMLETGKPLRN